MEAMFTTHPDDGPGKYYLVMAEAGEWSELLEDLDNLPFGRSKAATKLVAELKGWGIG
jgi:hypothetical protein